MSIKQPIYHEFDLNATSGNSRVISLTHTDDAHVDVIELCVKQQGAPVDLTGATVIARMVLHSTTNVLLNDSVPCTINDAGNILIPFDNAAVQTRKGIVKIEVNITRDPDILTLQLPLWVKINGSILDDATVDPHSEGTIPELLKDAAVALEEATEALEHAGDYDNLEHKPSINGHTLSDNKTSADLDLQGKLTAGTNITIESDGTISASGGVTSYKDLTDKPTILADDNSGIVPSWPLLHNLQFDFSEFVGLNTNDGKDIRISIKSLFSKFHFETYFYDFNRIGMTPYNGTLQFGENSTIQNFPTALNRIDRTKTFYIYQAFDSSPNGGSERTLLRKVFGRSANGDYLEYAQLCYIDFYNGGSVTSQTDWVKLSGGSQIVSGVVNQNGTITFTDSDGSTFTTTGSSVIGADGFSPAATVTQTQSGATVTITDKNGTTTANISNGADGQEYVLTAQDKSDIADIVLSELPTTQGVLYGNTNN